VNVRYNSPPGPILDLATSRFDISINNIYLASHPLARPPSPFAWLERWLGLRAYGAEVSNAVPPYDVFGQNELQFYFDTRPLHRGDCVAIPSSPRVSIDPESTLDLSRAYHFTELPNLSFFVSSGFPFTRLADLSGTAVVLPNRPSPLEEKAFLDLMGRLGALTGYPVVGLTVVQPGEVATVADRDLLVLSTFRGLQGAPDLLERGPLRVSGTRLDITLSDRIPGLPLLFGDPVGEQRRAASARLAATGDAEIALILGTESPLQHGRSLVALLAATPEALDGAVATLSDSSRAFLIQGDLSILSGAKPVSYRIGSTYTVGHLPLWVWPSWYFRNSPLSLLALLVIGALLGTVLFMRVLPKLARARLGSRAP
jgi:hypothetical protein